MAVVAISLSKGSAMMGEISNVSRSLRGIAQQRPVEKSWLKSTLKSTTALVSLGIMSGIIMASATPALAQDEEVDDEIIVTGSYIRRGNFDSSSPINIIDQSDLLRQGRPQMGEVIRNQTFNYGTTTIDNIEGTTFQFGTFSQANLRGLGAAATLTLMDGRRSVNENVNLMYPQIAIQRVETLLDGAAALYGTDAVAGVVNFIPFKEFEGMKVNLSYRADDHFDTQEVNFGTLFGAGNDRTHVVGAIEINDRTRMKRSDRPKFSEASQGESFLTIPSLADALGLPGFFQGFTDQPGFLVGGNNVPNGAPGSYAIPLRSPIDGELLPPGVGLLGAGANFRTARDPGCANPNFSEKDFGEINRESGLLTLSGGVIDDSTFAVEGCSSSFADLTDFIADQELIQGYVAVQHQITDNLRVEGEVAFNRLDAKSRGFLSVVGGRFDQLATIPGELPGNPFVATLSLPDFGTTGGNPILLPVYARDTFNNATGAAGADGIADRRTDTFDPLYDINGDGLADVILASGLPIQASTLDPTGALGGYLIGVLGFPDGPLVGLPSGDTFLDGSLNPANGISFREDVRISDAVFGGKNVNPLPQFAKNFADDGTGPFAGTFEQQTWRLGGTLVYEIPNSNWLWQGSVFYHRSTGLFNSTDNSFNNANLGFQGQLLTGTFIDNVEQTGYFNPFSTAQFDPNRTNLTGPTAEDTDENDASFNSQGIVDRIFTDRVAVAKDRLIVVDSFVTGDLFDLPGGTVGAALGVHYRHERAEDNQPSLETLDDQFVDRQELDSFNQRDVWAIFGELAVPLFDTDSFGNAELSLAGRYEDYGSGQNTFDPKIGLLWKLFDDSLSLRGSWGTSFVAPSLDQLFGPPGSFLRNTTDPLLISAFGTAPTIFVTTENNSNPNLVPETAETWNFGVSWEAIENLILTADYYSFDFTDRLVLLAGQDNLNRNALDFLLSGRDPTSEADVLDWIANEETIVRRLADGTTPGFISGSWQNASAIKTKGMDFGVSYLFDAEDIGLGDIGTFSFNAQASWIHSYDFQLSSADISAFDVTDPDDPIRILFPNEANIPALSSDRAGDRNDPTTAIPPLPEWRINANVTWNRGPHTVNLGMRFVDNVKDDAIFSTLVAPDGTVGLNQDALGPNQIVPSHTELDLAYTFAWEEGVFGDDRQTIITIGSLNILDNDPPAFNTLGGIESFLHDPRGRMVYARVQQDL